VVWIVGALLIGAVGGYLVGHRTRNAAGVEVAGACDQARDQAADLLVRWDDVANDFDGWRVTPPGSPDETTILQSMFMKMATLRDEGRGVLDDLEECASGH
jgi:hypothetical protein